ncbi:MAG: tetratricopeptide repeat protein [Bacteroidia bacterium]|nr:tetratricopeptide repeat protein [Bacteroidia bacterium]
MYNLVFRFFLVFVCFSLLVNYDAVAHHDQIHKNKKEIIDKINFAVDDTSKIYYLNELAKHYTEMEYDDIAADSVNQIAIDIAERTLDDIIILRAYNNYLETNNVISFKNKAEGYCKKAEQIVLELFDPERSWKTYNNIGYFYFHNYEYENALKYAYDAFTIASNLDNDNYKVQSYLLIGRSLELQNKKIDALRNFFNALIIAEKGDDKERLMTCYKQLSRFYKFSKMHAKSEEYKIKEFDLIKSITPIDSTKLIWSLIEFEGIKLNSPNTEINESTVLYILDYIKRHPNSALKNEATAVYRTYLVSNKKFNKLREYYTDQFPGDLVELKNQNYTLYLRTKAFMCEDKNEIDSALYYFNQAGMIIDMHPNKSFVANFYIRFGEFYERQNNIDEAIMMYRKSLDASKQTTFIPFIYKASNGLKKLYATKEDFPNAYKFATLSSALSDSLSRIAKLDQLVAMEIDNESRLLSMLKEREQAKTKRRHNIQYTAIVILIFTAFLVLMLLGKYNVKPWVIRAIGFFAFIFAFEFVVLIADGIIHHATHGEPWKMMIIKIVLIGILLPLHHFIEGVAVKYVLTREKKPGRKVITVREFVNKYVLKEGEH